MHGNDLSSGYQQAFWHLGRVPTCPRSEAKGVGRVGLSFPLDTLRLLDLGHSADKMGRARTQLQQEPLGAYLVYVSH